MQRKAFRVSGFIMVVVALLVAAAMVAVIAANAGKPGTDGVIGLTVAVGTLLLVLIATGFIVISPNDARVVQFFGKYVGTIGEPGFHWTWPMTEKSKISKRLRNFESNRLKVSDADGNPVEIAAVVVWRVVDTYAAKFAVDDFVHFVEVQAETAVRHLATSYPYEAHASGRTSLRDSAAASEELTAELRERVTLAGVEVVESRITHLAYAAEIAQAMLARQQAQAIVAARSTIVEGAVGMVSSALEQLREQGVVDLDEERKAHMVSNLLVVLCGDRNAQPVVNTGSLY
ncbi:SPFH domain-containing protein [Catellatospora citrea]|uniref:Membrane protein n=1 Tax=Catellatospora citrea TaxID=53366 RepID=A0A8J3P1Z9_9ACTN|nr:SPFH domain-containing protein [Catellatospora citrea]RKE09714.1 regulator of protease activity HflC (stomatin/prohibitin superfamily) [Catellatospora citrea]GIG00737.1 membrane protein [Catellatospora citrea]